MKLQRLLPAARDVLKRIPGCSVAGLAVQLRCSEEDAELLLAAAKAPPKVWPRRICHWSFQPGDRCQLKDGRVVVITECSSFSNGFGGAVPTEVGIVLLEDVQAFLQE